MAYKNFFVTRLYTDIGASDTTITLETAPTATSGRLVLEARNSTQREIIKYTGLSGNQITGVLRGQGDTTAKSHLKNALVEMNLTAEDIQDLYDAFTSFAATNGSGWLTIPQVPTVITQNGQKEVVLRYSNVDLTNTINEGTKGRFPRTGTTPTQSMNFVSASLQYAARPTASVTGLTFTDDFSCEALVYLDSYSSSVSNTIISRYGAQGWIFRITATGQINIYGNNGTAKEYTSNQAIPTGRWVHVAAKLDMSGSIATTWIDGNPVPGTFNGTGTALNQTGQDLQVGRFASSDYFNGRIANIRVWSTMRTDAEIRDNYARETPASTTGLVAHFKGNGSWNDSSTNLNHLTTISGAVNNYAAHPFSANEFAFYTKVVKNGADTDVTVYTGTSFIPSETLGVSSYSAARTPFGFPANRNDWMLQYISRSGSDSFNAGTSNWQGTTFQAGLTVPTGKWLLSYSTASYIYRSSGVPTTISVGLAPATTFAGISASGSNLLPNSISTFWQNLAVDNISTKMIPPLPYATLSMITLYAIGQSPAATSMTWYNVSANGHTGVIQAECAYL